MSHRIEHEFYTTGIIVRIEPPRGTAVWSPVFSSAISFGCGTTTLTMGLFSNVMVLFLPFPSDAPAVEAVTVEESLSVGILVDGTSVPTQSKWNLLGIACDLNQAVSAVFIQEAVGARQFDVDHRMLCGVGRFSVSRRRVADGQLHGAYPLAGRTTGEKPGRRRACCVGMASQISLAGPRPPLSVSDVGQTR